jgi:hypothetical protein
MAEPAVVLSLKGPGGLQPAGRPVPLAIEVRNEGPEPVWMVAVLDGSEEGVRYPHYRPRVLRDGEVVAAPGPSEDPLVGPVRTADLRRLEPGESFDPTGGRGLATFTTFAPPAPGTYVYELTLSTRADPEAFLGRFNQDRSVVDPLGRVPPLELVATEQMEVGPPA